MKNNQSETLAEPEQAALHELFYGTHAEANILFSNCNYEHIWNITIEGKNAYHENLWDGAMLVYLENDAPTPKITPMADLIIYAIEEFWMNKSIHKEVYYKSKRTGESYSLYLCEHKNFDCYFQDDEEAYLDHTEIYAYKESLDEKKLRGNEYITFFNERHFKIESILECEE